MTRKEKMDLLLTKVQESEKEAFIADLRQIEAREEIPGLLEKYHITLTEEEKSLIRETASHEISDEDLDQAAGGGCTWCWCNSNYCSCSAVR